MEGNSGEPVQVFVRLRPEFGSEENNNTANANNSNSKLSKCCVLVDERTIKISPTGTYALSRYLSCFYSLT